MAPRSRRRRPETQTTSDAVATLAKLLARRPLSEREARERLEKAGIQAGEIDAALSHGRDSGWIDDRAFARLWVEDRLAHHPLSRRAIAEELRGRKISRDLAAGALDEYYPAERERELAVHLAEARLARLANLDDATRRRRTMDFLTRRGFAAAIAADAVRRALAAQAVARTEEERE